MIDHYLKDDEKEKTFSRGELGYIATVGTEPWYRKVVLDKASL